MIGLSVACKNDNNERNMEYVMSKNLLRLHYNLLQRIYFKVYIFFLVLKEVLFVKVLKYIKLLLKDLWDSNVAEK